MFQPVPGRVTTAVLPRPAATVVVLRPRPGGESEALLIQRPESMAFAAGMYAFPGGRVDEEDAGLAERAPGERSVDDAEAILGGNLDGSTALAVHRAAARELEEETGIRLSTSALTPIAHWTTPPFMTRRFSTWFFVADLPDDAAPVFAPDEVADHAWLTPADALERLALGDIGMWVPTASVLQRLVETGARSAGEVANRLRLGPVSPPRILFEDEATVRFSFTAGGGLPGRSIESTVLGVRDLVVVDPGDPSDAAIDAIDAVAKRRGGTIQAVVLTASDPDRAAGAEALAIPHDVPILVAPGAGRHLPYATRELGDGEALPDDVDLRVSLAPAGTGRLTVERATSHPASGASAGE